MRVSFVGQMIERLDEHETGTNVVFVRLQAWCQVLCSPVTSRTGSTWSQWGSLHGKLLVEVPEKTTLDTEVRLHSLRGCDKAGLEHILAVGHHGRRVHIKKPICGQNHDDDYVGSVFYPGKFGAGIKKADWLQPEMLVEVTDQFGAKCRLSFDKQGQAAHIEFDEGVYARFEVKEQIAQQITLNGTKEDRSNNEDTIDNNLLCLPFSTRQCENVLLVGGKGASLSMLTNSGANVPPGFCLTTTMFQQVLNQHPQVRQALDAIQNCGLDKDLEQLCRTAEKAVSSASIAEDLIESIEFTGNSLMGSVWETRLAVRSSGVDEDSAGTSTAGQNETFLGVIGRQNVLNAISLCWSSLFAYRSVQYRLQNGQPLVTSMGVVVQTMVPANVAGVLFTADPLTGNPGRYTITASWGLGEAVVSGSVDPDTIVVDVTVAGAPSNIDIQHGSKTEKIIMAPDGGTEVVPLNHLTAESCLNQKQIQELVAIGQRLTKLFGQPQDIEFAIADDEEIYILQSRPITTAHRLTDWELEHEYDSAQATESEICTKANLGEVVPGALSPLTRSILLRLLDTCMQINACKKADLRHFMLETTVWVTTIQHHGLLNVLDGILKCPQKAVSVTTKAVDFAVFGHEVTRQEWLDLAVQRHGLRNELRSNIIMLQDLLKQGLVCERYRQKYLSMELFHGLDSMSALEIMVAIERSFDDLAQISYFHTKNSECSSIYQMIVFLIYVGDQKEWSPQILQDVAHLLAVDKTTVDVESAGVPFGLQKLSNAITFAQGWREQFALADTNSATCWLKENLDLEWQEFIAKFGHRCLKEFELLSSPWKENMYPVIATLQAMLKARQGDQITSVPEVTEPPTKKLISTGNRVKDFLLSCLVPLAHKSVSRREESKSMVIKAVHQIRIAYRALAQSLLQQHLIPSQQVIFYLSHHELRQLVFDKRTDLIPKAVRREKLLNRLEHLEFPEIVVGCRLEEEEDLKVPLGSGNHADLIQGTPASPGQVTGLARVITRLDQAATIQPGEILITTSTDIGWSPYFPILAGVVTELGGLISHGAVVAREYGLPCLVGARGATRQFASGDLVRIDTALGILYKVYKNSE